MILATDVPDSACLKANAICSSEKCFVFACAAGYGRRKHDVVIGIGEDYRADNSRADKLHERGISLEQVRRVHPLLSQLGSELLSKQNVVQLVQERHARNDLRLAVADAEPAS